MNLKFVRILFVVLLATHLLGCNKKQKINQLENIKFNFKSSDQVNMPVKVSGKGSDVCFFVPGGPGGGYLSFEKLGGDQLEKFSTMVYMDQRGSGDADSSNNYSMDRMIKDIDEVRAELNVDKIYLMSHSFGGVILINYARKYPQHVKGLILVNSALYFFSPQMLSEEIEYGYSLLGKDSVSNSNNRDLLFSENMAIRSKLSKVHKGYKFLTDSIKTIVKLDSLDSLFPRNNDFGYAIFKPFLDKKSKMLYPEYFTDYTPLTKKIQFPVLIINGLKDHAVGPEHYKLFQFPNQKIVNIDGGHLLYHEKNNLFVNAVKQFYLETDKEK